MNGQDTLHVSTIYTGLRNAFLRNDSSFRRWILLLVSLHACVLSYRWAAYHPAWLKPIVNIGIAALSLTTWRLIIGRKRLAQRGSNIHVRTEEDPF